jgi:hypothetical protein
MTKRSSTSFLILSIRHIDTRAGAMDRGEYRQAAGAIAMSEPLQFIIVVEFGALFRSFGGPGVYLAAFPDRRANFAFVF